MPFIKYKAFALDSAICYKCGNTIKQGQFNWSYNTRQASMFAHRNCLLNEVEFKEQYINRELVVKTKEQTIDDFITSLNDDTPVDEITLDDITELIIEHGKHKQIDIIKKLLRLREYPFLYGAPGAGKTHLVTSLGVDMKLDVVIISCSADMFKSEITGSVSPVSGNYYSTAFRKAWEHGGVILFDEVGLAPGSFLNVMNAALAQKELRFPDGKRVPMHKDTFILFADNSALYGNDPLFPERQDAGTAFRDRIAYVKFDYDIDLELKIIKSIFNDSNRAAHWHGMVQAMRAEIKALDVPVFVSPRFAYAAAKAFKAGFTYTDIIDIYLMRGLNGDIKSLCQPVINRYARNF